jgi:hypothetical protein
MTCCVALKMAKKRLKPRLADRERCSTNLLTRVLLKGSHVERGSARRGAENPARASEPGKNPAASGAPAAGAAIFF